ncbi:hypothetical protein [Shewanella sp. S1-58-MNA-CIBAN-0166]|uniref:hypothetical protein n=1 Tax=Shewanella sp. S1-58-MNA-CIBAN-0166 TaxID=3140467 RepID=UPI00332EBD28
MANDVLLDYWHQLQSQRSDWAFRAYDRLVRTLSQDVQEKLQLKKDVVEPYIVIFGKTQVGKTTLLLDLMGIDLDQMALISQVLRGGRETGRSATATAMEYCCSVSEHWGLTLQSKTLWFDTNEEVTHALGRLREQMESGRLIVNSPCVVHIPRSFFASTTGANNVRILDLPGDNPANAAEQKHVYQMAKTYLPFADLVLLVGRGDDLSFLRPEVLTLPGIEDWQAMPHRFRIVTTYSYSAKSIKDLLRNDANLDITQIRQRLMKQIELFGSLSDAAKDENLYFPLEFGTSWKGIEKNEPKLYVKVAPIIKNLRKELLEQISNSTSPVGRLRSTLDTHLSVKYIRKKKEETISREISKLVKIEKTILSELVVWNKSIERSRKKLSKTLDMMSKNSLKRGTQLIHKVAKNPKFSHPDKYPPSGGKKNDSATLRTMISDYYRLLKGMRLVVSADQKKSSFKYWNMVCVHVDEPELHLIQNILDDAFGGIRSKIDSYVIDTYWIPSNYENDRVEVHNAGEEAKINLVLQWKEAWIKGLTEVEKNLKYECKILKSQLNTSIEEKNKALKQVKSIELDREFNHGELNRIKCASEEDLDRCDRFIHLLDEEYLITLTRSIDMAYQEDDACDALLQILSCAELISHRDELMSLSGNKTD